MKNDKLLSIENLHVSFVSKEGELKAIRGVTFEIREGSTIGVVGESGCGKSVTAQSIMGILPYNARIVNGKIILNKSDDTFTDIVKLKPGSKKMRAVQGREVSMIFQEPMTSLSPVYTVGNQISELYRFHKGYSRKQALEESIQILQTVGMPKPEQTVHEYPFNLSGGMRQRAMIAMALSCEPRLLIADEPTTAVDVTIQAQVLDLIKSLHRHRSMALMLITHDLGVIAESVERVVVMYLGKVVENALVDDLFYKPHHPYTKGLLASIPNFQGRKHHINPIKGAVPSLYERPHGCPFHNRCPSFMKGICDKKEPATSMIGENHEVSCHLYTSNNE